MSHSFRSIVRSYITAISIQGIDRGVARRGLGSMMSWGRGVLLRSRIENVVHIVVGRSIISDAF